MSSASTESDREAFEVTRLQTMGDVEEGECEGPTAEKVGENLDRGRHQGEHSMARDSFDLNHTLQSRLGERVSDDLGFSTGSQDSDSRMAGLMEGLAHQNHLPNHMIPAVREWLKSQGIRIQLHGSPLGPRMSKKMIEKRNGQEGPRPPWQQGDNAGV